MLDPPETQELALIRVMWPLSAKVSVGPFGGHTDLSATLRERCSDDAGEAKEAALISPVFGDRTGATEGTGCQV